MKNVQFYCVCNDPYQGYIPWFAYFVSQAYPECRIHVDLTGDMHPNIKSAASILKKKTGTVLEVHDNMFEGYNHGDINILKTLRWIKEYEYFYDREYLVIGDIDRIICKEAPSMISQHINHMTDTRACYSNFVRPVLPWRISGINVVRCKEWFDKTKEKRKHIDNNIDRLPNIIMNKPVQGSTINEQVLYQLISDAFPFSKCSSFEVYKRYVIDALHGVHIRAIEHRGISGLIKGETTSHGMAEVQDYQYYLSETQKMISNDLFNEMYNLSPRLGDTIRNVCRQT